MLAGVGEGFLYDPQDLHFLKRIQVYYLRYRALDLGARSEPELELRNKLV